MKNYSIQYFKECLFFIFCLFCFLLLSINTLHVMFYTYICYWNTFQYKYIIQITFHVVKQSHARVTSKDIFLLFITSYKIDKHSPFAKLNLRKKSFTHLGISFSFICFHWKITWHHGKVNKKIKTKRVSNWIDAQSLGLGYTSFNFRSWWLPKTTDKLLL